MQSPIKKSEHFSIDFTLPRHKRHPLMLMYCGQSVEAQFQLNQHVSELVQQSIVCTRQTYESLCSADGLLWFCRPANDTSLEIPWCSFVSLWMDISTINSNKCDLPVPSQLNSFDFCGEFYLNYSLLFQVIPDHDWNTQVQKKPSQWGVLG